MINEHVYRFNQIDKNYFSDRCAKIEAMSSRDSDQNLYKVQDCTTFFSYTPSQGSIFVLWSKKLKRVPHLALLLTLVARPSLADC